MPKKNRSSLKILTIDIETAPLESYTWGTWQQDVGLEQIKTEWSILSFAAKWLDNSKVIYHYTGGRGKKKVRDDKELLLRLHRLLDETDIVIAQNGKQFDLKKINARMAMYGIPPYSPVKVIDTLQEAKKHFAFTSNKLAWTSKYLTDTAKDTHKKFPGFELWLECLKDNPKAWAEMKKYNIRDIVATEKYYLRIRPWITNHPKITEFSDECHSCGSLEFVKKGWALTKCFKTQQLRCNNCGTYRQGERVKLQLIR